MTQPRQVKTLIVRFANGNTRSYSDVALSQTADCFILEWATNLDSIPKQNVRFFEEIIDPQEIPFL